MDTPEQVRDLLIQNGLAHRVDQLMALMRPSIRIFTQPADDATLPIGSSKIGGEPDLPPDFEWPVWEHEPPHWLLERATRLNESPPGKIRPLSFLAQFNLLEVAPFDMQHLLPASGILYFFYEGMEQPWNVEAKDGGAQIIYYVGTDLRRTPYPENLPTESRYKSNGVTFKTELTLPSKYSTYIYPYIDDKVDPDSLHLSEVEFDVYAAVENILYEDTDTMWKSVHRLLGYVQYVQVSAEPLGRLLLLQLDSDDYAGMMWGDMGKLYFWLPEAALAARRFDNAELELQCS